MKTCVWILSTHVRCLVWQYAHVILVLGTWRAEDPRRSLARPNWGGPGLVKVSVSRNQAERDQGRYPALSSGIHMDAHIYMHMHALLCIHTSHASTIHPYMHAPTIHTYTLMSTHTHIQIYFCTNQTAQANVQTIIKVNMHLKLYSGLVVTYRNSLSPFHCVAPSDQSLNGDTGSLVHPWQELQKLNSYSTGLDYGTLTLSENKYKALIQPQRAGILQSLCQAWTELPSSQACAIANYLNW